MTADWKHYQSKEATFAKPPEYKALKSMNDPALYRPSPELAAAVDVAVTLGMPLLVTGKPGCGKTELARHVAHRFGQQEPLVFDAKTTSTAQDLFYRYDALRHFQAASVKRALAAASAASTGTEPPMKEESADEARRETMQYIELQALGIASLLASTHADARRYLPPAYQELGPRRSVVLIDEIDKAPRDLPNDVLREIETLSFTIRETGQTLPPGGIDQRYRPILILTSNSEKSLPDAFLRRCAFFHIPPPTPEELMNIVTLRLTGGEGHSFSKEAVEDAVKIFDELRTKAKLHKEPSTAELLQWVRMLGESGKTPADVRSGNEEALRITCAVMATDKDDRERIEKTATGR